MKVGPDFVRPDAPLAPYWLEHNEKAIKTDPADYRDWWSTFDDAVLNRLINEAYKANLSLRIAGVRVFEARAQLALAANQLLPQNQLLSGYARANRISEQSIQGGSLSNLRYFQDEVSLSASWELDFWGKFRRGIESAQANLMATTADFDNALVSLTADTANTYVLIRTLEKRINIARQNAETQRESLRIVRARHTAGTVTQRDVEQAITVLYDTEALIPSLEAQLQQTKNALSVLLGLPPGDLRNFFDGKAEIPTPPLEIAIGIPADLIRRRPDVRSAEYQAAAQSARIGVAKADLFPAFSLSGTLGFLSTDVGHSNLRDIFRWGSSEYTLQPGFGWDILNYTRIINTMRIEDARLEQLLIAYQNAVLKAQREAEDGLVAFLRSQERATSLAEGARSAKRSFDLALLQYRQGTVDFTTVLIAQQTLLVEQDSLAGALGAVASNLVGLYRALGGGWQIRDEKDLVPTEIRQEMAKRINWGNLLKRSTYEQSDP
jgi:NodT family efflux transporter outer membrane factor (OMF) lipoprotein